MPADSRHRRGVGATRQEGVEEVERGLQVAGQHAVERVVVDRVVVRVADGDVLEPEVLVVGRPGVEVLVRRRGGVGHEPLIVEHVRRGDVVEPANAVQGRDPQPVERVAGGVQVDARLAAGLRKQAVERDRPRPDRLEGVVEELAQRPPRPVGRPVVREPVRPVLRQVVGAVERRDAVEPLEEVGHGHAGHDRPQRRMPGGDGGPLGEAVVRVAPHADGAVRPGLPRDPLERVVAVVELVDERVHLAARPELAAHVLDEEDVPAVGEVARDLRHPAVAAVLVIGQPDEHRSAGRGCFGQVDVDRERHAVSHRHHVLLCARVDGAGACGLELDRHGRGKPIPPAALLTSGRAFAGCADRLRQLADARPDGGLVEVPVAQHQRRRP